jgi:hypothetical protein
MTKGVVNAAVWGWLGLGAIAMGAGIGSTLGSVNLSQGTTLAVVTGMGAVLSVGWLSRRLMAQIERTKPEWWIPLSVRVSFGLGALNLAVSAVLLPISVWRIVWPQQSWPWVSLGAGMGGLGALVGGVLAAAVVSRPELPPEG